MAATRSAMFDGRRVPDPTSFRLDRPETMHAAHVVDAVHVDLPWRTIPQ